MSLSSALFQQVCGEAVGGLDEWDKGNVAVGLVDIAHFLTALEGEVPGTHMPTDSSDFPFVHFQTETEQYDD